MATFPGGAGADVRIGEGSTRPGPGCIDVDDDVCCFDC